MKEQLGKIPFDDDDGFFSVPSILHIQQCHQLHWHMPQSISKCDPKKLNDDSQSGAVTKVHN